MTLPSQATESTKDRLLDTPESTTLHAGPLTLSFTSEGDIRNIRYNGVEVLRRVYAAVRARDWWTVPARLEPRIREIRPDSFTLIHEAHYHSVDRGIDFLATITITGDSTGHIVFDFDGAAQTEFESCRIGICVLHPAEAAGAACSITHASGGEIEEATFPDTISPHQPFSDIATVTHTVAPEITATVEFAGDVFEMEDQRNWLDASFKTYSGPLSRPYPFALAIGDRVHQTVTLQPVSDRRDTRPTQTNTVPAVPEHPQTSPAVPEHPHTSEGKLPPSPFDAIPSIGLRWAPGEFSGDDPLPLRPTGHLWVEIDLTNTDWRTRLLQSDAAARHHGLALYICLISSDSCTSWDFPPLQSEPQWFVAGIPAPETVSLLRQAIPRHELSIGFLSNFTELNRARPDEAIFDGLFFAANPQVHAIDSLSIAETPPMIAEAIRTARIFASGKPIHVGPLTFTGARSTGDPRELAQLGQDWYRDILLIAAQAGADSITLGQHAVHVLRELAAADNGA